MTLLTIPAVLLVTASMAVAGAELVLTLDSASGNTGNPVEGQADDRPLRTGAVMARWDIGNDVAEGWYWAQFTGSHPQHGEWRSEFEFEPYRFHVRTGGSERVRAFSFEADEDARELLETHRHLNLQIPAKVTLRRSDRPIHLKPGDRLSLEGRWWTMATGDVQLIPADDAAAPDIDVQAPAEFHLFDDQTPPAFDVTIRNRGGATMNGTLEVTLVDALDGEIKADTHAFEIDAGGEASHEVRFDDLPLGAYTLHLAWRDTGGDVVTRLQRHFTNSLRVDAADLPDSWPFAFHLRPHEPTVPAVGFKWARIFHAWRFMEREQGVYDFARMGETVDKARDLGMRVLWVWEGTPQWASTMPDHPPSPRDGVAPFWGYPATDVQLYKDFLTAFWAEFASDGVIGEIEVLNEPNARHTVVFTSGEYREMVEATHEVTRELAPDVRIIGISQSGGLHMGWVNGVLNAGAGVFMDAASTHNYEVNTPVGPVSIESKVRLMRQALDKRGHEDVAISNTEAGVASWGRWGGRVEPASDMEKRARQSPHFDESRPHQVNRRWRAQNEHLASGYMVRSAAQQLAMGVERIYYFKWQATNHSWVHEWEDGQGNVVPKLMLPVQSVMSRLWQRYAGITAEDIEVTSPDNAWRVFAHRFTGPDGAVTVLYAHPKAGLWMMSDEVAGDVNPDGTPPEVPQGALPTFSDEIIDGAFFLEVEVPVEKQAFEVDMLARDARTLDAEGGKARVKIGLLPLYVVEDDGELPSWLKGNE